MARRLISFYFILKSSTPPVISASPAHLLQPKASFSVPMMPKASMAAAVASCAMRIVATASVGPSLPMPSMTVTVMASASTPPNQQYFGAALSAAKLLVLLFWRTGS